MKKTHYFRDVKAVGYREPSGKLSSPLWALPRANMFVMDATIAKGELLKANIAKMREARKGKF